MFDLNKINFTPYEAEDVGKLKEFFYIRPNKSCDSAPLDSFIWRNYYKVQKCVVDDECCMMMLKKEEGYAGCVPMCVESKLPFYFKLQEKYFNEVLNAPFQIYLADEEGVEVLKNAGVLDNYEVTEEEDLKDYLYEGEKLRTLAGKKLSKKRNHINKFKQMYEGRWEYRKLNKDDKLIMLAMLTSWKLRKDETGEGEGINENEESFDAMESLDAEILGVHDILNNDSVFDNVRVGGIFIDGELKAFSIGNYNPREKMAIIDIEKADPEIQGLYQMINQQFLINEFPEAELVNREDDVGLPGLRKAKLSYYPSGYERKYMLKQKDFIIS